MNHRSILFGCAMTLLTSMPALASEGQIFGGPTGGTDIRNAYLPPVSGLYGGFVSGYGFANRSYGSTGQQNKALHVNVPIFVAAGGLLYVYPFKIFGGTVGSTLQDNYQHGDLRINTRTQEFDGLGDVYSDLLIWSRYLGPIDAPETKQEHHSRLPYGLTVKLAYSMIFPTGKYNHADIFTIGHNDYFFIPNAAVTYLTRPNVLGDGLELDAHTFLDIASKNPATDYSTGTVADLDFAVSERDGRFQEGIAGYYAKQLNDDEQDGHIVAPDGKKLQALYLGPVVAYDIPQWRMTIKAKAQLPIVLHNSLNARRIFIVATWKF